MTQAPNGNTRRLLPGICYTASATRHLLHGICCTRRLLHGIRYTASAAHGVCYTASATRRLLHGVCYTASATRRLLHTVSATRRLLHGVPDFSCPEDLQRTGLLADDGSFLTQISGFDFHLQTSPDVPGWVHRWSSDGDGDGDS